MIFGVLVGVDQGNFVEGKGVEIIPLRENKLKLYSFT